LQKIFQKSWEAKNKLKDQGNETFTNVFQPTREEVGRFISFKGEVER
jgi:hypothetical protein